MDDRELLGRIAEKVGMHLRDQHGAEVQVRRPVLRECQR